MQIKNKFRGAAELTVSMTIIATLLAGCFGGGGGGTTAAATNSTTVTPFKGKFNSGTVTVFDANHVQVGSGSINASGVAPVTYLQTAVFPLILEVTGTYQSELGGTETSTAPIRGLIKDKVTADIAAANAASGVPVTAATEIAVASLPTTLIGLTFASAVQATRTAESTLGLTAGDADKTPVFNGAGKTDDAITLKLAALSLSAASNVAGTGTMADKIRSLATTLAALPAASAPNQIPALSGLAAAMTAMTSGASSVLATSGVMAPAFVAPASSVTAIQSAVAATVTQTVGTSSFLTDLTTTGFRNFKPGNLQAQSEAGLTTQQPYGHIITAALSNGIYTVTQSVMELINRVWTAITVTSYNSATNYALSAAGWIDEATLPKTFVLNADGTATTTNTNGYPGTEILAVSAVNLAGMTLPVASAVGFVDSNGFNASPASAVNASVTFPAGSMKYVLNWTGVTAADVYTSWTSPAWPNVVKNPAGAIATTTSLTTMLANSSLASPLCANGSALVATSATTADIYYQTWNATTKVSTCAIPTGATPAATAVLSQQVVNGQTLGMMAITPIQPGYVLLTTNNGPSLHPFIAAINGAYRLGSFYPAGTPINSIGGGGQNVNKTAGDAVLKVLGLPTL